MKHWMAVICFWFALAGCCPLGERVQGLYSVEGSTHYSIPGVGSGSFPVPDTFRISVGTTSDFVLTDETGRCFLPARIDDEALSLERGASCGWNENGVHFLLTPTHGRVELSEGGGRFDMAGGVTATARGVMYPGSFLQNATLTRLGD